MLLIILFIIGFALGYMTEVPKCPRRVRNWQCRGSRCDHRLSEYYRAKAEMAEASRRRSTTRTNV